LTLPENFGNYFHSYASVLQTMQKPCSQYSPEDRKEIKETLVPLLGDLQRVGLELCKSTSEADELVAETLARACEKFSSLRERSKAKQWLLRIMTNIFISKYRSRTVRREVAYDESAEDEQPFSLFDELSQPFFWWGNPEREVMNRFLDEDLKRALGRLPEESRSIVVMCDVEGYSYEEIASVLNTPIGTVRSRLSRARSELQRYLYDHAVDMGWVSAKRGQPVARAKA
jgi:RNA polymerase sigma-70 factor, ECF subfamily